MIPKKIEEKIRGFSPPFIPWVFKAHLIALVALAFIIPLALVAMPYLEWFNDMAVQPKGKTQSYYGWFEDEKIIVERPPVKGTLPMGYFPYHLMEKDAETAKEAEETLVNPLKPTREVLERGRKLYDYYCFTCHGKTGMSDGPIVGPDLFPAPLSLHTKEAKNYKDGRIFHLISRGQNTMPPYADRFDMEERWAIVHYVRVLQRAMDPKPEDLEK